MRQVEWAESGVGLRTVSSIVGAKIGDSSQISADPQADGRGPKDETTIIVPGSSLPDAPAGTSLTPLPGTPLSLGSMQDEIADESRCGFIPGYSLLGRLGSGGMGVVYQAVQERLQRVVAVKLLTPRLACDPNAIEIFKKEAMAVARLHHPNIVAAHDYGEVDGKFYLVLEYIEGLNCAEALEKHGRFAQDRAIQVIRDAVLGLSHAAAAGIIHRDVKPANLMLMTHGVQDASGGAFGGLVKVTDLGLARMAESEHACDGTIMGTPSYMAPEQARGESVDFRADFYALGATLYQLVTGLKPFESTTMVETLERKQREHLRHPQDVVPELSNDFMLVLDRMLARDRRFRYSTYEELLADLQALLLGSRPKTKPLRKEHSTILPRRSRNVTSIFRARTRRGRDGRAQWKAQLFGAKRSSPLALILGIALGAILGVILMQILSL